MSQLIRQRTRRGWSVRELSRISGVSAAYISNLEQMERPNPSLGVARALGAALTVAVDDLFPQADPPPTYWVYELLDGNARIVRRDGWDGFTDADVIPLEWRESIARELLGTQPPVLADAPGGG